MNAASCYRPVDLQLCQGDILERVPQLYLKDFPGPIRKTTGTGSRIVYELEELAPGAQATAPEEGILVPAHCQITRAMLLTYDCEIDKGRRPEPIARRRSEHRVDERGGAGACQDGENSHQGQDEDADWSIHDLSFSSMSSR